MDTVYGIPYRIVTQDPDAPPAAYHRRCRLLGIFCASVGLADLPTDPETPPLPGVNPVPVVTGMLPASGADGSEVVITGTGFQEQGEHSQVMIGTENAVIVSWTPTEVVIAALQGTNVFDAPLAVYLRPDDKQDVMAGSFTFTQASGGTLSAKGRAAAKKKAARASKLAVSTAPKVEQHTFPSFPSGAGVMLRNGDGSEILVGPFQLEAGVMYSLPLECEHGLEVVTNGLSDITLLLARPL